VIKIPLTRGLVAIVDDADEHLAQHRWHVNVANERSRPYAVRAKPGVRGAVLWMHREVLGVTGSLVHVDHVNRDTMDNRRCNLRVATRAENNRNRGAFRTGTSGFKGVSWHRRHEEWMAYIRVDGTRLHLGYFADPVDAARAYDVAAARYFGEFARLNFPEES
jgi:hypothetical protein